MATVVRGMEVEAVAQQAVVEVRIRRI